MNIKTLICLTLCGLPLFATYAEAKASKSISFKDTKGKQVSKDDTLYLFGWMEDGCIGDTVGYKKLKQNNEEFLCTRQKCSKSQRSWTRRQITY